MLWASSGPHQGAGRADKGGAVACERGLDEGRVAQDRGHQPGGLIHSNTVPPPPALHICTRRPGGTTVCIWHWVTGCPTAAENSVSAASSWNEPRPWPSCPSMVTHVFLAVGGAEGHWEAPTRRWVTLLPAGHQPLQAGRMAPDTAFKAHPSLPPSSGPHRGCPRPSHPGCLQGAADTSAHPSTSMSALFPLCLSK